MADICKKSLYIHFMKTLSYALVFGLIGLVVGAIVGVGETRYYKKSQRGTVLPVAVVVCGALGVFTGLGIGIKLGDDERRHNKTGLNTARTDYYKQGRFWKAVTTWTDPETGEQASITTGKNLAGELESELFAKGIRRSVRHNIFSGSQANVQKAHGNALSHYFKILKDAVQ